MPPETSKDDDVAKTWGRRSSDDLALLEFQLVERLRPIIENAKGEILLRLNAHITDLHAHPDSDKELHLQVSKLWDERNGWRGIMTAAVILGPFAAIVVGHFWR